MCGIIGFISETKNYDLIYKLTDSISHRGPDKISFNIYPFGNNYLHLGSSRLAITGLNDGDMPMHDESGNVLVYNGEIYELKNLAKYFDINLNSLSDTRHLLHLLSNHYPKCIEKINGMFAFAYYSKNNQKLILSRDRLGIKPLYFGTNDNFNFYFSSEIGPLITNNVASRKITEKNIREYLHLGGLAKNNQLISDISTLKTGSIMEVNFNGDINNFKFQLSSQYDKYNTEDINVFKDLFCEVLSDQLNAEIPVNILLSGGVDSALIALFAKKYLSKNITSFTLGYSNKLYDERSTARQIADELSINNFNFEFPQIQNEELIDEVVKFLPEPISDPSIIPTYYLSKEVSKKTKVVISGDGGDEMFGGYDWYRGALISKNIPNLSYKFLKPFFKAFDSMYNHYIPYTERLYLFSLAKNLPVELKILLWQNYLPSEKIESQISSYESHVQSLDINQSNSIHNLKELDLQSYLYTNILKKSDTASMLNGLEVRPVFLDNRLLNFSNNLKFSQNVNVFNTKLFLKNILKSELPSIHIQKKRGFAHDFGTWTDQVGIKYLKNNWKDNQQVYNFLNYLDMEERSSYFKSRYVWKYYSIFRWLDLNNIEIN